MSTSPPPRIISRLRKNFATGLLVLAPIWATIYLVIVVVKFIGGFLSPGMRIFAEKLYGGETWLNVVRIAADIVAFIVTVTIIAVIGYFVRRVIGERMVGLLNRTLGRIPVIREIYDGVSKFLQMLFGDKAGFQRVVAVRFPAQQSWTIGFITNASAWTIPGVETNALVTVFIPTAPIPTQGFLVLYEQKDIIHLEMSVDSALKMILSGGTLGPMEERMKDEG